VDEDNKRAKLVSYPPSEILDYTIEDLVDNSEYIEFYLPYQWSQGSGDGIGNPCPEDPLTIYWTADVNGCDDRVTYKTTFGALLDDVFEGYELWQEDTPMIGSKDVPIFVGIRDALQKEIDRLNVWIDTAKPEEKNGGN
jgi:hypothetical protein